MEQQLDLDQLIDGSERIAALGSPSSTTELGLDIMGTAVNRKLVGELALFRYQQDGLSHYASGQITEVILRNIWHEDPTMRTLIRMRGRVDAVSERQDTHQGEMTVSAVFSGDGKDYRPSMLGTVPATGTPVSLVNDDILNVLLSSYKQQLFYLGHVYGSTPKLPLWFKHFDSGPDGAGEAYHLGIFGRTGSGKSVLAKMILLAYARYTDMALLVIDPQGEFAKEFRGQATGEFRLPTLAALQSLGRQPTILTIQDLVLDRWELFTQILYESPFFEQLSIPKGENRELAARTLADRLQNARVTLASLHERSSFDTAWSLLGDERVQTIFYRSDSSRERFQRMYEEAEPSDFFEQYWLPISRLFSDRRPGAQRVDSLLRDLLERGTGSRPIYVIDLSDEQSGGLYWNETIRALVIGRLLDEHRGILHHAQQAYREERSLNTLVLIDEAHRLAPREAPENDALRVVRNTLIRSARETRKYGLGWLFISQTLSSLHAEIIGQLRIYFFGFGLSLGSEYEVLRQMVGPRSKYLDLYRLFRDPHSSFDIASREYSFMTVGPVSPLSFSGTPLFFNAFNDPKAFLDSNQIQIQSQMDLR